MHAVQTDQFSVWRSRIQIPIEVKANSALRVAVEFPYSERGVPVLGRCVLDEITHLRAEIVEERDVGGREDIVYRAGNVGTAQIVWAQMVLSSGQTRDHCGEYFPAHEDEVGALV